MSRMLSRARALALVVILALVLTGCAGSGALNPTGPKTINVTMTEFGFTPKEITLLAGQPVKLVLKNDGTVLHDFSSPDAIVVITNAQSAMHDMADMKLNMHAAVEAGQQSTIEFTATQAGTYTFFCTVAGHKEAGMLGKMIVK